MVFHGMKKKLRWLAILCLLFVLAFGGLVSRQPWREQAVALLIHEAEIRLNKRGESVKQVCSVDFSPFVVEFGLRTEKSSYYVMGGLSDPWWLEATLVKYFMEPDIQIITMEFQGYSDEECTEVSQERSPKV